MLILKMLKSTAQDWAFSYLSSARRKRDARVGMFINAAVAIIMTIAIIASYFIDDRKPDSGLLILKVFFTLYG